MPAAWKRYAHARVAAVLMITVVLICDKGKSERAGAPTSDHSGSGSGWLLCTIIIKSCKCRRENLNTVITARSMYQLYEELQHRRCTGSARSRLDSDARLEMHMPWTGSLMSLGLPDVPGRE